MITHQMLLENPFIYHRDNKQCILCGADQHPDTPRVLVLRIIPLRLEPDNGIT